MVRLVSRDNIKYLEPLIVKFMTYQMTRTHFLEVGNKHLHPCIYATWHSDQMSVYGLRPETVVSIMVSASSDGELISKGCEAIGLKTVRGSSNRKGAVEGSLKMLDLLKQGESVAITVDGPRGPLHVVKNGVIKIAQMSGAPIVPMLWHSEDINFIKLPSWDKLTVPVGQVNVLNLYGEPIYVPKELDNDKIAELKKQIKDSLYDLRERIPAVYKDAKKNKLWKKTP